MNQILFWDGLNGWCSCSDGHVYFTAANEAAKEDWATLVRQVSNALDRMPPNVGDLVLHFTDRGCIQFEQVDTERVEFSSDISGVDLGIELSENSGLGAPAPAEGAEETVEEVTAASDDAAVEDVTTEAADAPAPAEGAEETVEARPAKKAKATEEDGS